jgi:hypothetical protein
MSIVIGQSASQCEWLSVTASKRLQCWVVGVAFPAMSTLETRSFEDGWVSVMRLALAGTAPGHVMACTLTWRS